MAETSVSVAPRRTWRAPSAPNRSARTLLLPLRDGIRLGLVMETAAIAAWLLDRSAHDFMVRALLVERVGGRGLWVLSLHS